MIKINLTDLNWTKEDYEDFKDYLLSLADEKYKEFSSGLIPGARPLIGIRIPILRDIAKQIAKGNWKSFFKVVSDDTFEEVMLQGLLLGYLKTDIDTMFSLIEDFIPKINDWSVCDSTCTGLKRFVRKNKTEFFKFIKKYFKSKKEFELRFGVIILMDNYIDDNYIDEVLKIYDSIKNDGYYVKMGVAWGISECFIKYNDKTMAFLKHNNLDNFTYNKALQKIVESNRVDKPIKLIIKEMKRKT